MLGGEPYNQRHAHLPPQPNNNKQRSQVQAIAWSSSLFLFLLPFLSSPSNIQRRLICLADRPSTTLFALSLDSPPPLHLPSSRPCALHSPPSICILYALDSTPSIASRSALATAETRWKRYAVPIDCAYAPLPNATSRSWARDSLHEAPPLLFLLVPILLLLLLLAPIPLSPLLFQTQPYNQRPALVFLTSASAHLHLPLCRLGRLSSSSLLVSTSYPRVCGARSGGFREGADDSDELLQRRSSTTIQGTASADNDRFGSWTSGYGFGSLGGANVSAAISSSSAAPVSTPAPAHADSTASLIHSTASLTQSPSPQPATPPDLSPAVTCKSAATVATPRRDGTSFVSFHSRLPSVFTDDDLIECDVLGMAAGALDTPAMGRRPRQDSFVSAGPKPITMNKQNRDSAGRHPKESLAGSLMGGSLMSGSLMGGMSFGSFVRDDIMMQGTSPSHFGVHQGSSSLHSTSYLPRLEANFMRDFTCCDKILPNLHDLLHHYEESHTQMSPTTSRTKQTLAHFSPMAPQGGAPAAPGSRMTTGAGQMGAHPIDQLGHAHGAGFQAVGKSSSGNSQLSQVLGSHMHEDMDAVADMEMDDDVASLELDENSKMHQMRQLFGQQQRPQLSMDTAGLTQGLRTSQPPTPAVASFGLQNNPTVSSVNTPTLMTHQQAPQQSQCASGLDDMDVDLPGMPMGGGRGNFNGVSNTPVFCINDPAKHLSPTHAGPSHGNRMIQEKLEALGLQQGQFADSEANKLLLQRLHSLMMPEEPKPFKCPVIGCEKMYKNQNGLKYHKAHGHQTQQLHENGDGTFSIVNPETSSPYPGTLGMEKEKPFNCETCGKRYKNLNGLKYHKGHSLPCNPEFKLHALAVGLDLRGLRDEQALQP